MNDWRKSKHTFEGQKLVEHKDNQNKGIKGAPEVHETALVGRYGEIWEYSDAQYSILIHRPIVANKVAKLLNNILRAKKGDELVFRFPKNLLSEMVSYLKIPKSHMTRVRLANAFRTKK